MADILIPTQLGSALSAVPSGYLDLYADSATNRWWQKNSAGVLSPLGGGPVQWKNAVNDIGE